MLPLRLPRTALHRIGPCCIWSSVPVHISLGQLTHPGNQRLSPSELTGPTAEITSQLLGLLHLCQVAFGGRVGVLSFTPTLPFLSYDLPCHGELEVLLMDCSLAGSLCETR